jgi:hypothetical protein
MSKLEAPFQNLPEVRAMELCPDLGDELVDTATTGVYNS